MTKKEAEIHVTKIMKILSEKSDLSDIQPYVELNCYKKGEEYHHYYDLECDYFGCDIWLDISNEGYFVVLETECGNEVRKKKIEDYILSLSGYNYYIGNTELLSDNDDVSVYGDEESIADEIIRKCNFLFKMIHQVFCG